MSVTGLNLHEIKTEFLLDYTGDFELYGSTVNAPVEHKTKIRFRNMNVFESYINAIDIDMIAKMLLLLGMFIN